MEHCTSCDIVHEEIFKGCPLCEANETIKELENDVSELQSQIDNMEV